jgi:hypothetical protein
MNEPGGPFTLTHQDLARIVGVSVTTIKSYRRKFPEFFFPPSQTKPLRFRPETEKLCLRIAAFFTQGWSIKRARQELSRVFPVVVPTDKLPIVAPGPLPAPTLPGPASDQLDRVLLLLGQMNKGLGAMATAQARFDLDSQKERQRLDTLISQQATLNERLDTLARTLEQMIPALLSGPPSNHKLTDQSQLPLSSDQPLSESFPIDHLASGFPGSPTDIPAGRHDPAFHALPVTDTPASPPRRVIHVQGKSGTQAYEFIGDRPNVTHGASPTTPPPGPSGPDSPAPGIFPGTESTLPLSQPTPDLTSAPPSQTQHIELKPDFLHLPVVLRSSRGEYLGLTSTSGHPFTLAELEIYLSQRPDLKPMQESWKGQGERWNLNLHAPDSDTGWHSFHFIRTQTPKGNHVALLGQLDLDGTAVTEAFLQAFFRQIKEALT